MRTYSNSIVIKFDTASTGNAGSGKPVTVFHVGTTNKADLFDSSLAPIANPVHADDEGNYTFTVNDGTYDLYIDYGLPTQTAILNEQISNIVDNPPLSPNDVIHAFDTLADAVNETNTLKAFIGSYANLGERTAGNGGGALWKYVDATTVTPNTFDIVQCIGLPALAIQLLLPNSDPKAWGAIQGGDSSGAINAMISEGQEVRDGNGDYILDDSLLFVAGTSFKGVGVAKTKLTAKSTLLNKNMVNLQTSASNIYLEGVEFDNRNDIITPTYGDAYLENIINGESITNLEITRCKFSRSLNRSIILNGSVSDENSDIYIHDNEFEEGARGGVNIVRYGRNIKVINNKLTNSVNSVIGGISFEKSISISGSINVWAERNTVVQTNDDAAAIIVEYQDRSSSNVHIRKNAVNYKAGNTSDGNNIKVGASDNVWVIDNTCEDAGASGVYIEGCLNTRVMGNAIYRPRKNGITGADDAQTTFTNRGLTIKGNTLVNCNVGGAALGTTAGGASNDSFAIATIASADRCQMSDNVFIDDGETFNGVLVSATNYEVIGNDFSQLNANRIAIDNHFSTTSTKYKLADNINCATTDSGVGTIANGSPNVIVNPEIIPVFNPKMQFSPNVNLNNGILYLVGEADAAPDMSVRAYNASNATVNATADITFNWAVDVTDANGIFGKTA